MKVGIAFLNKANSEDVFEKVKKKFNAKNSTIEVQLVPNFFEWADTVGTIGTDLSIISVVCFYKEDPGETIGKKMDKAIKKIAVNTKAVVIESNPSLKKYLLDACMEESVTYETVDKISTASIYDATMGTNNASMTLKTSAEADIAQALKMEESKPVAPILSIDEEVPVIDDVEEVPVIEDADGKNKGGLLGKFGNKNKAEKSSKKSIRDALLNRKKGKTEEVEVPIMEEEAIPVVEEEVSIPMVDEPEPEPVMEQQNYEEREVLEMSRQSDEQATEIFNDADDMFADAFSNDSEPTPIPVVAPVTEPAPVVAPVTEPVRRQNTPKPQTVATVEEPVQQKKGLFSGKKGRSMSISGQKPTGKQEQLSMVNRPKIILVTGSGRIGVSTYVASLGYQAAVMGCKSLIVDLDVVKRTQSAIFQTYTNPGDMSNSSLIGSVRSPYLVDELAQEHYTNVSTIGINLLEENPRKLAEVMDDSNVATLLNMAATKYTCIICDVPWDYIVDNPMVCACAHDIIYVTSNDLITIIDDINTLDEDAFDTSAHFHTVLNKTSLLLNMVCPENAYNNKAVNSSNIKKVMADLIEDTTYDSLPVIGEVPNLRDIGNQAAVGQPASMFSKEMAEYCRRILLAL